MNQQPQSLAAKIVTLAVTILAASFILRVAARWLLDALPVLVPAGIVLLVVILAWRHHMYSDRW